MIKPNIISFLDVVTRMGDVELDLEEVFVKTDSYLENKTLLEAQIPSKTGLIVLGREDQVNKLRNLGDERK